MLMGSSRMAVDVVASGVAPGGGKGRPGLSGAPKLALRMKKLPTVPAYTLSRVMPTLRRAGAAERSSQLQGRSCPIVAGWPTHVWSWYHRCDAGCWLG